MAQATACALDYESVVVASERGLDARDVAMRLRHRLPDRDLSAVMVFFSADYDPCDFAGAMAEAFPLVPVFGCSTAGELGPNGIEEGGVVALGFRASDFRIVAQSIPNLNTATLQCIRDDVAEARARLDEIDGEAGEGKRFGLLLVDGLSLHEEGLISAISASLDDIHIVGGSAGDGMRFESTWVMFDGKAHQHAAVLLLVSTDLPFRLFKCNSFKPTATKLVVTEADIEKRIVRELNAEPAAHEYARIIGVPAHSLNGYTFAAHPVIVRVDGDYYARSIRQANEDGSLTFFCAIDEGLVLTAAERLDTLGVVEEMFLATEADLGEVALYIGFDCLHRRLDAEQRQIKHKLAELYRAHNVVGFNTYGEQYRSMHLNQTFSGLAIGRRMKPLVTIVTDDEADLVRENAKLRKINAALMSRVERAMDQPSNAFSLFEAAIALDNRVRRRTAELQDALRSVERSNAALKTAKFRADQANAFKSTFLAFVSHDLLQPLNAAKLSLCALMELETSPAGTSLVGQVDRALSSLEDLIRTLLDISRLDAGAMLPDVCAFEIERVIGPLRLEFEPLAATRGLKLNVRRSTAVVRSDPLMLRRILQNLLNNALRYTKRGGVLLGCRERGGALRIEVVDTGPGIPADRREAIFEEFQRDAVTGAEHGGFGLGLSIVRRLALALGHSIDLASRVSHGSKFAIEVPLESLCIPPTGVVTSRVPLASYGLDAAHVLVLENEPAVAQSMRSLLEQWGCGVMIAMSGAEACAVVRADGARPDLIIADLHLENGELGFDAIRAVQGEVDLPIPAFLLTADHSASAASTAAAHGIEILHKPVKPAELRSLMAHLLA